MSLHIYFYIQKSLQNRTIFFSPKPNNIFFFFIKNGNTLEIRLKLLIRIEHSQIRIKLFALLVLSLFSLLLIQFKINRVELTFMNLKLRYVNDLRFEYFYFETIDPRWSQHWMKTKIYVQNLI